LARDLEQHPPGVAGDVRAADVGDDLEFAAELVDDGLFDQVSPEDQLETPPRHEAKSKFAQPPATAGTIEISSFSETLASSPAPRRTSSSLRETFTNWGGAPS